MFEPHQFDLCLGKAEGNFINAAVPMLHPVCYYHEAALFPGFRMDSNSQFLWKHNAGGKGSISGGIHWRNGRDLKNSQPGIDDAASKRVIVRRTSRRSADQYTVTAEPLNKAVSDGDIQMNRSGMVAFNDDLVQTLVFIPVFSLLYRRLYGLQILDVVPPLLIEEDELIQFIGMDLLEETQMPSVHS